MEFPVLKSPETLGDIARSGPNASTHVIGKTAIALDLWAVKNCVHLGPELIG
jgi:hypothetical protein